MNLLFDKLDKITTNVGKQTEKITRKRDNLIQFSIEQELMKKMQTTKFSSQNLLAKSREKSFI